MKTALVTGGCGFVGRHLVRRLLRLGYDIWIIDDLSVGQDPKLWLHADSYEVQSAHTSVYRVEGQQVTFIHQNALIFFAGGLEGTGAPPAPEFDLVFALASVVGGRRKIDGDPMEVAIDLALDSAFFLWAVRNRARIGRVLYASSSAAYPTQLQRTTGHVALREDMIRFSGGDLGQPDMTYGWSKLTGEYLARIAAQHYGLPVACVRPFSGYGEDQDVTYPVPAIALRVARGDNPIVVWGTGQQSRDFVYIEDCITAMLLAVEKISDGSGVNIGTGRATSFIEVARLFAKIAGYEAEVQPLIDEPVGVQARYCDPAVMQSRLGWFPPVTIEEGFKIVLTEASNRVRNGVQLPN